MRSITLAIIPGTTFTSYQFALAERLKSKGIRIKIISPFRFHLTEAKYRGHEILNSDLDSLLRQSPDVNISDQEIDLDTTAFRKMFKHRSSYRILYRKLVPWFGALFSRNKIDAVLVHNGSKIYQRSAIKAAHAKDIPVIYLENGYLHGTMQIDLHGVNFNNSLAQRYHKARDFIDAKSYVELREHVNILNEINKESGDVRISGTRGFEWWLNVAKDLLVDPLLHSWIWRPDLIGYLRSRIKGKSAGQIGGALPDKYLLLVLQVECDTQHILHCPLFQTMREAIRICLEARDLVAPDLPVVVRPHPGDPRPAGALELTETSSKVMWDEITPLDDAIIRAEVVCTINSSVGFQSLLAGKRVFVLGEACYALPSICPSAIHLGSAAEAMRSALEEDVDNPERMKFLTYATKNYFVYDSWAHLTASGLENSATRIYNELAGT